MQEIYINKKLEPDEIELIIVPGMYKLFSGDILNDERLQKLLFDGRLKAEEHDKIEADAKDTPLRYQYISDDEALGTVTHIKCTVKRGTIVLKPNDRGKEYIDKIKYQGYTPMAFPRGFTKITKSETTNKAINLQISRLITFDIGYVKEKIADETNNS